MKTDYFIFQDKKSSFHKLQASDILFVKSMGNYLQIYTSQKKVTVLGALDAFEQILGEDSGFFRIHRSYIVNLNHVEHFSSEGLKVQGKVIPVSQKLFVSLKETFIARHLLVI